MAPDIKDNISQSATWLRGLFMLIFIIIYSVAEFVLGAVVLFQFLVVLFSGETNARLRVFGRQLSRYIYHVFLYLTFNREAKPFPFDAWPEAEEDAESAAAQPPDDTKP